MKTRALLLKGIVVLVMIACKKDVAIPQSNGSNNSSSSSPNLITNGSFENGLNGWSIENIYFQCDSPYIYVRKYNKVPPGGGMHICVMVNGTAQGFCWFYYPHLSQKITNVNGNKLQLSFWTQCTCTMIGNNDYTHQIMDSITMATQYPGCVSNPADPKMSVTIKKNNSVVTTFTFTTPPYKWRKIDTVINISYVSTDTLKVVFAPPISQWALKCFLLDMVELKKR